MLVTDENFTTAIDEVAMSEHLTVDVETTGLYPWKGDRICGIAIRAGWSGTNYYFPFRHQLGYNLHRGQLERLIWELSRPHHRLLLFNAKFDLHMLLADDLPLPAYGKVEDGMLAAHLMNENEETFALKRLADKYLGEGSSRDEKELVAQINRLHGKRLSAEESWKAFIWTLPAAAVEPYACADVDLTYRLTELYRPALETWKLTGLWGEMNDYTLLVTKMEQLGIRLDTDEIHRQVSEAGPNMLVAEARVRELAELPEMNVNSPKQLVAAFGWPATNKDYLELLTGDEAAEAVLDFRTFKTQADRYFKPYLELMDPQHDLRPNYNMIGTIAGRLSCYQPQLQSVPRRTKKNRVKDVFVARPGTALIEVDYSQAELRLASHYGPETTMAEILRNPSADLHAETARLMSEMLGREILRDDAKRINFSAVYGIGAATFSKAYRVPIEQAKLHIDAYHRRFPGFRHLANRMERLAMQNGYIRLETGRVRRYNVPEPYSKKYTPTYRASSNWVQGTVAEVMRTAMQRLDRELWGDGLHQLVQVHDSILFECPTELVEGMVPEIQRIMSDYNFRPALRVDVKVGDRWGTLQKVDNMIGALV